MKNVLLYCFRNFEDYNLLVLVLGIKEYHKFVICIRETLENIEVDLSFSVNISANDIDQSFLSSSMTK